MAFPKCHICGRSMEHLMMGGWKCRNASNNDHLFARDLPLNPPDPPIGGASADFPRHSRLTAADVQGLMNFVREKMPKIPGDDYKQWGGLLIALEDLEVLIKKGEAHEEDPTASDADASDPAAVIADALERMRDVSSES